MAEETMSTEDHLITFIEDIAEQQMFDNDDTLNITVGLFSAKENFSKFKIKVTQEGKDDLDLFAKVTELADLRDAVIKPYEKERLFYTSLMRTYRLLEDKHGVPEEDRLNLPVFYGAEVAHGREILVLEDLTSRGCGSSNPLESVCWPYAAAAITELAKLHALSMAFKQESPSEFEEFTALLPGGLFERNKDIDGLLDPLKSLALRTVRSVKNKRMLQAFFEKEHFLTAMENLLKPLSCKVILHAHFWPKNMMHKLFNDGSLEVISIDYQTIQVGSPVTDLFHFMFTATDAPFRAAYYEHVMKHYVSELHRALTRLGRDIAQEYSGQDLVSEINEKLPYGLFAAVVYLPVLAFVDRTLQAQGLSTITPVTVEMFSRRLNEVVEDYVDLEVLRENQEVTKRKRCRMCLIC